MARESQTCQIRSLRLRSAPYDAQGPGWSIELHVSPPHWACGRLAGRLYVRRLIPVWGRFQLHAKKESCIWKRGIQWGGTNGLSPPEHFFFYRTRLHCQCFFCIVYLNRALPFVLIMSTVLVFSSSPLLSPPFGRKDDRGLRLWLGKKPAIDWMQHTDLKEGIIIWVAFDFPDIPYPDFGLLQHSPEWRDGISRLRRTSCRSGAPWCTEPPRGSLPRATALSSTPVTSRRGNITPRTYRWLPTQVSQTPRYVGFFYLLLLLLLLLFYFKSHECSSWVAFVLAAAAAAAATYTHLKAWLHFFFSIMLRPKACPCSTGCERLLCGCTKLMVMFFGGEGGYKRKGELFVLNCPGVAVYRV